MHNANMGIENGSGARTRRDVLKGLFSIGAVGAFAGTAKADLLLDGAPSAPVDTVEGLPEEWQCLPECERTMRSVGLVLDTDMARKIAAQPIVDGEAVGVADMIRALPEYSDIHVVTDSDEGAHVVRDACRRMIGREPARVVRAPAGT